MYKQTYVDIKHFFTSLEKTVINYSSSLSISDHSNFNNTWFSSRNIVIILTCKLYKMVKYSKTFEGRAIEFNIKFVKKNNFQLIKSAMLENGKIWQTRNLEDAFLKIYLCSYYYVLFKVDFSLTLAILSYSPISPISSKTG